MESKISVAVVGGMFLKRDEACVMYEALDTLDHGFGIDRVIYLGGRLINSMSKEYADSKGITAENGLNRYKYPEMEADLLLAVDDGKTPYVSEVILDFAKENKPVYQLHIRAGVTK